MVTLIQYLRVCAPQNFGVSFSIISVITGIPSLFLFGLVSIFKCSLMSCLLTDYRLLVGQLLWCGDGSSLVGAIFLSFQSQWFTWCKTAFFTMLIGLAMAGTFSLRVHEGIGFITCSSGNMQRTSDKWRSIFLGGHDFQASRCSLCVLGHRLVQPPGTGSGDDGNQVRYCAIGRMYFLN